MTKNTEIRAVIDERYLFELQKKLDIPNITNLVKVAFTILDWAAGEAINGRKIMSADIDGYDAKILKIRELDEINNTYDSTEKPRNDVP